MRRADIVKDDVDSKARESRVLLLISLRPIQMGFARKNRHKCFIWLFALNYTLEHPKTTKMLFLYSIYSHQDIRVLRIQIYGVDNILARPFAHNQNVGRNITLYI